MKSEDLYQPLGANPEDSRTTPGIIFGSYPGNLRNTAILTGEKTPDDYTRFVRYGNGDALVLASSADNTKGNNLVQEKSNMLIEVTVPENVKPGQKLIVTSSCGRNIETEVPQGLNTGDKFLISVERLSHYLSGRTEYEVSRSFIPCLLLQPPPGWWNVSEKKGPANPNKQNVLKDAEAGSGLPSSSIV
mmetsp:Transcript_24839/g.38450  ORF Transcript_24839/g.38450 Transcript_24839/m.38450 type:complete len:189 (+) Transcript_24839:70-636(+)